MYIYIYIYIYIYMHKCKNIYTYIHSLVGAGVSADHHRRHRSRLRPQRTGAARDFAVGRRQYQNPLRRVVPGDSAVGSAAPRNQVADQHLGLRENQGHDQGNPVPRCKWLARYHTLVRKCATHACTAAPDHSPTPRTQALSRPAPSP